MYGLPMAVRGSWSGDDTFVIEYRVVHQRERGTFSLEFGGDIARMTFREVITGLAQTAIADREQ